MWKACGVSMKLFQKCCTAHLTAFKWLSGAKNRKGRSQTLRAFHAQTHTGHAHSFDVPGPTSESSVALCVLPVNRPYLSDFVCVASFFESITHSLFDA